MNCFGCEKSIDVEGVKSIPFGPFFGAGTIGDGHPRVDLIICWDKFDDQQVRGQFRGQVQHLVQRNAFRHQQVVQYGQHQYRIECACGPLQEAGTFAIAPAFGCARATQVHNQWENVLALIPRLPPKRADTTKVAVDRHHLRAGAGCQVTEMTGIASDIQNTAGFKLGQRRAYEFLLGGEIRVGVTAGILVIRPDGAAARFGFHSLKRSAKPVKQRFQDESGLFVVLENPVAIDGSTTVFAREPRRHGDLREKRWQKLSHRPAEPVHVAWIEAVTTFGKHIGGPNPPILVGQQRQQKRPAELRVRFPNWVPRNAALEREHVNEDRLAPAKQHIVGCCVFQRVTVAQTGLRHVQRQHARCIQHLRRPLVGIAGEFHTLMLKHRSHSVFRNKLFEAFGLPQLIQFGGAQPAGGNQLFTGQEQCSRGRRKKRLDFGQRRGVHGAQHPITPCKTTSTGISERGNRQHGQEIR